ncbi:MAG: molybdenum ABC transporter ATP-binding protein [Cognatishimia sp.]|uniref:molybdenum ABC transporter ATP-binding protein n=1 Tax=Cognatishimia sp. TaxID=2211648 RepID=UPI003B8AE911
MTLSVSISSNLDQFALEVDFKLTSGVTAIFGASGAGKTTVINTIAGLHRPDRGHISFQDEILFSSEAKVNVPTVQRRFGYVFQDHRLFPHMTVEANLTFAQRARRRRRDPAQFARIVEMLGLGNFLKRYPVDLSGGEKQRVAIGRALLSDPHVLLLDEPLASLDQGRREEILPYLERLRDHAETPMIYVSHSVSEVARLANQVVLINQGQQMTVGPVGEVFLDPETTSIMRETDIGAVLFAKVKAHHDDGVTEFDAAGGQLFLSKTVGQIGDIQRVRIRAQDVMLSLTRPQQISALNILAAEVLTISQGANVLVGLKCGSDRLLARITERSLKALNLTVGQNVFAILKTVSIARTDVGAP